MYRHHILTYSNFDIAHTINQKREKKPNEYSCIIHITKYDIIFFSFVLPRLLQFIAYTFACVMRIKRMAVISKLPLYWLTFGWLFVCPCHFVVLTCMYISICCESITTCYHLKQRKSVQSLWCNLRLHLQYTITFVPCAVSFFRAINRSRKRHVSYSIVRTLSPANDEHPKVACHLRNQKNNKK